MAESNLSEKPPTKEKNSAPKIVEHINIQAINKFMTPMSHLEPSGHLGRINGLIILLQGCLSGARA